MNILRFVLEPSLEHRRLVEELCSILWDGTTAEDVYRWCRQGDMAMWAVPGGLVLTEIVSHPRGRELFLFGIVGSGIIKAGKEIVADLKELAEQFNCKMIGGQGLPEGWERVGPALGFRKISTRYLMEL